MKTENKALIDAYFEALCDENFTNWSRFENLLSQLDKEDKVYFLEKWKTTAPVRRAVELLKEGGFERLDKELKDVFGFTV